MWGAIGLAALGLKGLQWLMEDDHFSGHSGAREFNNVEISLPRVEAGSPVPMFFGTVRTRSPILAWYGGLRATQVPPQIVAYKGHFLYWIGVPCPSVRVQLKEMYIGERRVSGTTSSGSFPLEEDDTAVVGDLNFFGGPGQGGSLFGTMEFRDGLDPNQTFIGSAHEIQWINFSVDPVDPTASLLPGYRGIACVALSNWEFGESERMESYTFKVLADCQAASIGGYPMVNGLDANPVAVLRALIVDPWFGLGYDDALIDDASFLAAALKLKEENLGVSGAIDDRDQGIRWMGMLLDFMEAAFYKDRFTGTYKLKLIRNDYDPGTIPVFDDSNVESIEDVLFTTYQDALNEVVVRYTDLLDTEDLSPTETHAAQNAANIAQNGNRVRSTTRDYPWASTAAVAARLAARDLAALGTPLFTARIVCSQDAYTLNPGDPIKLVWPELGWGTGVVVRVLSIDHGTLGDEKIVLSVIQDRFGVDYGVFDVEPTTEYPPPTAGRPMPVVEHVIEEMPFNLQTFSMFNQYLSTNLVQRLMYLAVPKSADTYRASIVNPDDSETLDMAAQSFCGRASVETSYLYALEPYDVSTGLRIHDLAPVAGNPGSPLSVSKNGASYSDIAQHGVNLIYVNGEIMAFEGWTDLGGGVVRLEGIWRALADTAPVNHFVGERVYFLNGPRLWLDLARHVGQMIWDARVGESPVAKLLSSSGSGSMPSGRAHEISVPAIRRRWKLPLRVADLTANGAKGVALVEDGVTMAWRAREYGLNVVTRGNDPTQLPTTSTTFMPVAVKDGTTPLPQVDLRSAGTAYNLTSQSDIATGRIGHGMVSIGIETRDVVDGVAVTSWQNPTLLAVLQRWRNLLLNPRFASALVPNWTTLSGGPAIGGTTSLALGRSGSYVEDGGTGGYEIEQRRDAHGYDPSGVGLSLGLLVGAHVIGDGTDEFTLTAELLTDALTVLDADVVTGASPTNWTRYTVLLPYVAGTKKIVARFLAGAGELAPSTIRVAEFDARIGQMSADLVVNGSFEGGTTGWTDSTGSFTDQTTTPYDGATYIRGGTNATNERQQTITVPSGFEADATAVLNVATMRDGSDTDDTGEIILEALDGAAGVLATATSGVYTPVADSVWERKLLSLDLPDHTASIRIRLRALRVTDAGAANVCFDLVRCRLHKDLDVVSVEKSFTTPPMQAMPTTWEELVYAFPTMTKFSTVAAVWGGDSITSLLASAPTLVDSGIEIGTRFPAPWDGTAATKLAWRFPGGTGSADLAAEGSQFGNFTGAGSFWVLGWIRIDPRDFGGVARGLFGRRGAARGWEVSIDATGHPVATAYGSSATKTVTSPTAIVDGRPHRVGIRFGVSGQMTIVVDRTYTTVALSGLGTMQTPLLEIAWFRVGRALAGTTGLAFQLQSLVVGYSTVGNAPSNAELDLMMSPYIVDQVDPDDNHDMAIVVPDTITGDGTGIALLRLASDATPVAWDPVSQSWALALSRAIANLAPTQDFGDWIDDGGAGLSIVQGVDDVEGFLRGVRLTGTNSNRVTMEDIPTTANGDVRVTFFARETPGAPSASLAFGVILSDGAYNVCDTASVTPTQVWQRFDLVLDFSGGTTLDSTISISPSTIPTTKSIEISGPFIVHEGDEHPIILPYAGAATAGGMTPQVGPSVGASFWYGGQITAQIRAYNALGSRGNLVEVSNGIDDVNRRAVVMVDDEVRFSLYNGSSLAVTSEVIEPDIGNDDYHKVEARWSRAGLIDQPTAFGGVEVDDIGDYDVASTFTVDAAGGDPTGALLGSLTPSSQPNVYIASIELTRRERLP